jgi:ABC-2 type transport system ATP-binding protein
MASVEELCDHITLINASEVILQGEISKIRENYRADKYLVSFQGDPDELSRGLDPRFELLNLEKNGMGRQATIRLKEGEGSGPLIKNLVEITEIKSFHEILPSMNDIFIQVVNDAIQKKGS